MANTPFVGDVGTEIIVEVGVPSADIISAKLLVRKPDGTLVEWYAVPIPDTTQIKYTVQPGDFDQAGDYIVQAYIETSAWTGYGTKTSFYVDNPI